MCFHKTEWNDHGCYRDYFVPFHYAHEHRLSEIVFKPYHHELLDWTLPI